MTLIQTYNEHWQPSGSATKKEIYTKHLRHTIVRLFLFNKKMELLLQHRGITESSYPDYWDQSAGGHVDEGETDLQAIRRETFEELGISINEFIFVNEFYTENRRNIIYQAAYDGSLSIDKNEVDAVKWFSLNKVLDKVNKKTLNVTPSCLDLIKYFNTRK